jgi:hypothetical protein
MALERSQKKQWLKVALGISAVYAALVIFATWFAPPAYTVVGKLLKDFQGNLIAGLVANGVFLVLAMKLDEETAFRFPS